MRILCRPLISCGVCEFSAASLSSQAFGIADLCNNSVKRTLRKSYEITYKALAVYDVC